MSVIIRLVDIVTVAIHVNKQTTFLLLIRLETRVICRVKETLPPSEAPYC